jgi:hypothetical protein
MVVRLSALRTGLPPFNPRKFLVLISVRGCVNPRVVVRLHVLGTFKKTNYLIGTRTCDLPACSIAPQPSTLLDSPHYCCAEKNAMNETCTETRNVHKFFVKSKQKKTIGRQRHERKVKIKNNVKWAGCMWTKFRLGDTSGLLWTWKWKFGKLTDQLIWRRI